MAPTKLQVIVIMDIIVVRQIIVIMAPTNLQKIVICYARFVFCAFKLN